ncbi:MAG: sensory box histidine kinase [Myxococcaceae bacterium]|nr:sensory box histidine kinase [Myxococcaceae bacterium]
MVKPDDASGDDALARYEQAPCGLLTTRANGTIERVNGTFCTWLGFASDQLLGIKRLQDLLTVGCKIFHQTHWMPLLQMQRSVAEVQLDMVRHDGQVIPVLLNALQRSDGGVVYHDVAVFMATDRRKYERELLQARKRAEELLESERAAQAELAIVQARLQEEAQQRAVLAEQLIGIVSHDLRTPLNAVLLGTSLLNASGVSPSQSRTLKRITSATGRANRLIEDLLDFTQARLGGGLRVQRRELQLHELVHDCVEELRLAWPGRMIDHLSRGEGTCWADADRIAQVVTNLVNNAMTYGVADRPITIASAVSEQELTIEVHNFGPTVPRELLPHLFEPLRRGEQQVKSGSRSVGLGLYIVQQIVAAHGGTIQVRSQPEEGTTFVVRAPSASLQAVGSTPPAATS